MLLENIIPNLPTSYSLIIYLIALSGIVLLVYGVFLESEKRQNLVMIVSASCLFIYALIFKEPIFMLAMAGLFIANLFEFVEIMAGIHQPDKYELKRIIKTGKEKIKKQ